MEIRVNVLGKVAYKGYESKDKWKREEWRRPHGKEIKNKELWQELSEQMEKHRVSLEFSESTRYSDRLQSKMREKEENNEI